jgi:hypothetical protein
MCSIASSIYHPLLIAFAKNTCRELRQAGGSPSGLHHGNMVLYGAEPGSTTKRQRASHSIPLQSAGLQSPMMPSHSVSSAKWGPLQARGTKARTVYSEYYAYYFSYPEIFFYNSLRTIF